MIQSAIADVVGPAVAAEKPYHLLAQLILVLQQLLGQLGSLTGEEAASRAAVSLRASASLASRSSKEDSQR